MGSVDLCGLVAPGCGPRYVDKSLRGQWANVSSGFGWPSGLRIARVGRNHHSHLRDHRNLADGAWLRVSRRAAPRHECRALAAAVHAALLAVLRHRFHSVLPGARTAAISLPPLLHYGWRALQLLPQL